MQPILQGSAVDIYVKQEDRNRGLLLFAVLKTQLSPHFSTPSSYEGYCWATPWNMHEYCWGTTAETDLIINALELFISLIYCKAFSFQ